MSSVGRLKILVDTWLGNFNEESFFNVLKHYNHVVMSSRRTTDEFNFETVRYEVQVSSNSWKEDLLTLAWHFCNVASIDSVPAILEISQDVFLAEFFNPIDENIPLHSFALGSLINPFFFREHRRQFTFPVTNYGVTEDCMKVTFEHDNDTIKLRFREKLKNAVQNQRGGRGDYSVDLNILYKQIQRIVVHVFTSKDSHKILNLYLYLLYPPEVRKFNPELKRSKRVVTWKEEDEELKMIVAECPVLQLEFKDYSNEVLYNVLSRLRKRTNIVIEFASVGINLNRNHIRIGAQPLRAHIATMNHSVLYLIEAILSRGAIVKDVVYETKRHWDDFVSFFVKKYESDPEVTLAALEAVLAYVTETRDLRPFETVYKMLWRRAHSEHRTKSSTDKALLKQGYEYVRKVIVTPSRHLLMAPELMMGNRGLRDFKQKDEDVIRIQFRDDDGDKLRENRAGRDLINDTVGRTSRNGLTVAGVQYEYFGYSSSQLRDNGCYCFAKSIIGEVRSKTRIAAFSDDTCVPKLMSRVGQYFTQAERMKDFLGRERYRKECYDIIGGKDKYGKPYTFSDGVGMMSQKYAEEISNSNNLDLNGHVPSCFQFRFRGMKGVLAVNKVLDELRKCTNIDLDFCVRKSQDKFDAFRFKKKGAPLEIVKYSCPSSVAFNRPFVNIIDQVSEKQSTSTHERIVDRVHELMDQQIASLVKALTSEKACRQKLKEMPMRMDIATLGHGVGFQLTSEPFFRSILQAYCRFSITKLRIKNSISIPTNLGRSVFGIVDESGQLQYGQVFCQITRNGFLKNPTKSAEKQILKGKILMTKNPAIVGGDVRVFDAVDVPELQHLVDVVVFPRYGPRPHPDEMAGSDLDGDEYVVIWDQKLLFDHNEPAMDFPKPTPKAKKDPNEDEEGGEKRKLTDAEKKKANREKEKVIIEKSCDFFVEYVRNDSVGMLAVRHLAVSDMFGIDSKASVNIAKKHAMALDFPKTGEAPDMTDVEVGERSQWNPDFLNKRGMPSCRTPGLNGQIYRRAQTLDDILRKSMSKNLHLPVELDPDMEFEGWEGQAEVAKEHFANYGAQICSVMEKFGIEDEAQLFSGAIFEVRSRIAAVENDLYGAFNVYANIERITKQIFMSFRVAFFERFGRKVKEEDLCRTACESPSEEMRQLASAYYMVAYEEAKESADKRGSHRLLSFPWVVWDILADVKKSSFFKQALEERNTLSLAPFSSTISQHMARYCNVKRSELQDFMTIVKKSNRVLASMCDRYIGLSEIFFFLCVWADENGLFTDTTVLQFDSFCMIMMLFGMRRFHCPYIDYSTDVLWFDDDLEKTEKTNLKDLHMRYGGIGSFVVNFLQFAGSREFANLKAIDLSSLNCRSCIDGCDLKALHKAASTTHNEMVFGNSTDPLPQAFVKSSASVTHRRYEEPSFTIALPKPSITSIYSECQIEEFRRQIVQKTGVAHVVLRQLKKSWMREATCVTMVVSAIGSLDSLDKLRNLLIGDLPARGERNITWCEKSLAQTILKRIVGDVNNAL